MSDDKTQKGGQDRTRINTNEDYELRYWSEKFNVSEEDLKKAVDEAGTYVEDVQEYFRKKGNSADFLCEKYATGKTETSTCFVPSGFPKQKICPYNSQMGLHQQRPMGFRGRDNPFDLSQLHKLPRKYSKTIDQRLCVDHIDYHIPVDDCGLPDSVEG